MNIEKKIEDSILKIHVKIKLRKSIDEEKVYFFTDDLLEILKSDYEIEEIISKPYGPLSNSASGGKAQSGEWVFKIVTKKNIPKPRKTVKDEQPKQKTTRSPRKKTIRNRMSNIAQNKKEPS